MPGNVRVGGTWRSLVAPFVNVSGVWKSMTTAFVKVDGTWRPWFSTVAAPTFTITSRTTTSLNITISNYDNRYTYSITSNTGTISGTGSTRTVTGIAASTLGTAVTISGTATYQGATSSVSSTTTSTTPSTPTLSAATPTSFTSFQFTINNYNASANYLLSTTAGVVSRSGSTVTVSSLSNAGTSATVTVTTQNPTYLINSAAAQVTGTSTALVAPILVIENRTLSGFRVRVTNIQPGYSYSSTTPSGLSQSSPAIGTFDFTGGNPNTTYSLTVTGSISGYSVTTNSSPSTLDIALPTLVVESQTASSFRVRVTNIESGVEYTASISPFATQNEPSNGTFDFTGMSAGSSFTVTVTGTLGTRNRAASTTASTLAKATGGNSVVDSGIYRIHIFTNTGTFIANTSLSVEVLMVGAGGGGGSVRRSNYSTGSTNGTNGAGGGGGGGAVVTTQSFNILAGSSTVVVGGGGAGSADGSLSAPGAKSYWNVNGATAGAPGGGYGGTQNALDGGATPWNFGDYQFSGGGGGGGVRRFTPPTTEARTGSGGFGTSNGGNGYANNTSLEQHTGGGGGGAAGIGLSSSSFDGGRGGSATTNSFSGTSQSYGGGGGGGGTRFAGAGGAGSANLSGGNGQQGSTTSGTTYVAAQSGYSNTGGGGGGGTNYHNSGQAGGSGGSGIIMIRYVR